MNEIANALRSLLAHSIVSFTYQKVNGEIRHAIGTRNLVLAEIHTGATIPTPKGEEQPNSYYDVEKMGWRSYKPENLISIDGVYAREDTEFSKKPTLLNEPPKEAKKPELPKREIPISKPMGNGGADIDKILGGIFGGFGGGIPKEEIRKSMKDLDKDIVIGAPAHSPKIGTPKDMMGDVSIPIAPLGGKVGTPTTTEKGIALPLNEVSVEDFAKMVAHYVVEEFVSRIKG